MYKIPKESGRDRKIHKPLPDCVDLVLVVSKIRHYQMDEVSKGYLLEKHQVESIDELLENAGIQAYIKAMKQIIDDFEANNTKKQ